MTDGWELGSSVHSAASREAESGFESSNRQLGTVTVTGTDFPRPREQAILQLFFAVARTRREMDGRAVRRQTSSSRAARKH
jgi:hypothetical protein